MPKVQLKANPFHVHLKQCETIDWLITYYIFNDCTCSKEVNKQFACILLSFT